jgi:ubiquitin-like domain-containing CTD phosphatase 1
VHVDDVGRNFVMNPQSVCILFVLIRSLEQGIKIKGFKDALNNRDDRELLYIARYLLQISLIEDLTTISHKV